MIYARRQQLGDDSSTLITGNSPMAEVSAGVLSVYGIGAILLLLLLRGLR